MGEVGEVGEGVFGEAAKVAGSVWRRTRVWQSHRESQADTQTVKRPDSQIDRQTGFRVNRYPEELFQKQALPICSGPTIPALILVEQHSGEQQEVRM